MKKLHIWLSAEDVLGFHENSTHGNGTGRLGSILPEDKLELLGKTEDNRKILMKSLSNELAFGAKAPNGVIFIEGGCKGLDRLKIKESLDFPVLDSPDLRNMATGYGGTEPESLASAIGNLYAHINDPDRGKPKITKEGSQIANTIFFGGLLLFVGCLVWLLLIAMGIASGFELCFILGCIGAVLFIGVASLNNEIYGKGKW